MDYEKVQPFLKVDSMHAHIARILNFSIWLRKCSSLCSCSSSLVCTLHAQIHNFNCCNTHIHKTIVKFALCKNIVNKRTQQRALRVGNGGNVTEMKRHQKFICVYTLFCGDHTHRHTPIHRREKEKERTEKVDDH